ncbi:PD-(D/E)XK nuclease domain-containing protein [Sphaerotilus sulfidivorans]|nr:hypothetical protein CQA4T8M7_17050 [Sphaerotilus natans]
MTVVDMTVLYAVAVALRQIRARGYADKYRDRGEPIHLIGVEFGRAVRNVVGFEVETVEVGRADREPS